MHADEGGQTRLKNLRQSGSIKLVLPITYRADAEAIIVNTAGGITGGDQISIDAHVASGAALTLTTQAAERAYRAQSGEVGTLDTTLTLDARAKLNWLPQEMILFDACALRRNLNISLADTAQLLLVEPLVFGRAAMHEKLHDITFQDRIQITRNDRPIYLDGLDLHGDASAHLARPAIANGAGAMANLVYIAPDAATHLEPLRAMLPRTAGASLLNDDTLVARILAADSFDLRQSLVPILDHLTHNTLPTSWRL